MKYTTTCRGGIYALLYLLAFCIVTIVPKTMEANETIGFIEDFALAENREKVLEQLIPGTEDYYYFHALHYQNGQQWDQLASIMEPWVKRYGENAQVWEIRNRQALMRYPENNTKTLDYLQERLQIKFNHQQQKLNAKPDLPIELDPGLISWKAFLDQAFRYSRQLNQVEDSGLDKILRGNVDLDPPRRRELLQRLVYPDYERLVGLIAADLRSRESRGFGEFKIHENLLPTQLDELEKLRPELASETNFIQTRIRKLCPGEAVNWRNDPDEREAYLNRLWDYVSQLNPTFNSLKAHVLYQLLSHHRGKGNYPDDLWKIYIQLPKPTHYTDPDYLRSESGRRNQVDLNANFKPVTSLHPIGDDESLVRDYLLHTFVKAGSYENYQPYIKDEYLKRIFAEAKLTTGTGDAERWYSLLNPSEVQTLKDRVDIEFSPINREQFDPEDEVVLHLDIKNVKDLVVKVYEINTLNFYLDRKEKINTDLNLDGLIANEEFRYRYDETPILRKRRSFDFKSLNGKRGVWIVEFIGNGVSSRALVRKGELQYLSTPTAAGTLVTLIDESNTKAENPSVWLGGREYQPDDKGRILLPFSKSGKSDIILKDGDFAAFDSITLPSEAYRLNVGFHVERETLLPGAEATVAIHPGLYSAGNRTAIELLEEVKLVIKSTNHDGIESVQEVSDFELFDNKESSYTFRVPQRLSTLEFSISGKVDQISKGGGEETLSSSQTFEINSIDELDLIVDLHLAKIDGKYIIEVLGKTGEALSDRGVNFQFNHEDFTSPVALSLKSDQNGRINLGELEGIKTIQAAGTGFNQRNWSLHEDYAYVPATIHSKTGETVEIALSDADPELSPATFAIFEIRKGNFVANHFAKGSIKDGILEITGLEAGDYEVYLRETGKKVTVKINQSDRVEAGYLLSKYRHLELGDTRPLQISTVSADQKNITIALKNSSPTTRVILYATRFLPEFSLVRNLIDFDDSLYQITRGDYQSRYLSGRDIGEEYRYIIERRNSKTFPGNMAARPGLILNPWALRDTDTSISDAEKGDAFKRAKSSAGAARNAPKPEAKDRMAVVMSPFSSNLDFLPSLAPFHLNLEPDENGVISVKREVIGDRQHLHVVAIDRDGIVYRQTSTAEGKAMEYRDLRLKQSLETTKHFTQRRKVTVLDNGESLNIADIRASDMETYDTLSGIYAVLSGLSSGDASDRLSEFSFILDWPTLPIEKKRELYSKYASHELSFFLSRRDNEFFENTIKPYLVNKRSKTFMDHYLLGSDLRSYLEPWKFGRLNIVERILLGRKLGGADEENTIRAVREWLSLIPSDPANSEWLFRSALLGKASEGRAFGGGGVTGGSSAGSMAFSSMNAPMPVPAAPMARSAPLARQMMADNFGFEAESESLAESDMVQEEATMRFEYNARDLKKLREQSLGMALYRKLDSTKEWAENNYYHLPITQQVGDLITVNEFWNDYAGWDGTGGFYSRHFTSATRNFAEMMFAISVLDLPFSAEEHEIKIENESLTLNANSPVIVFHEEIEERKPAEEKPDILISQNFFRADDRFKTVDGERTDKFVTTEFLTGVLYGCQVVMTNPTSSTQKLDVLLQLPEGAMPVALADYTKTYPVKLDPFSTEKLEFAFYFPEASGEKGFSHYPVHIAKDESPIAWSEPFRFTVVDELTDVDKASWEYLSQFGDEKEVLDYLEQNNVHFLDLSRIAWRMKGNVDFFRQTIRLLKDRRAYSEVLWSYSLLHNDPSIAREFLTHQENFLNQSGQQLECQLVTIDPVERHWYQHLEYTPLVNARVHQLGRDRKILNDRFHSQYHQYMKVLSYAPNLNATDRLGIAYYLLLQDRIEEGLEWFATVDKNSIESHLQYDYLKAYAALYQETPEVAAEIAAKYNDHGIDRWRERFATISEQVQEIQGANPNLTEGDDREKQQDAMAAQQPTFDLKTEGAKVLLTHQNLNEITVNYYEMDLEFLFSSQPFVSGGSGQFSYIRPNFSEQKALPGDSDIFEFELPNRFKGKNVLVEAVASGRKLSSAVYANDLKVQMAENYGRIQIRKNSDGSPLSKTYIKVYARYQNGEVKFFKDGYTDLRGKFDYVSLNTDEINRVDRFSVLIMNEAHGSVVKEAAPPRM